MTIRRIVVLIVVASACLIVPILSARQRQSPDVNDLRTQIVELRVTLDDAQRRVGRLELQIDPTVKMSIDIAVLQNSMVEVIWTGRIIAASILSTLIWAIARLLMKKGPP